MTPGAWSSDRKREAAPRVRWSSLLAGILALCHRNRRSPTVAWPVLSVSSAPRRHRKASCLNHYPRFVALGPLLLCLLGSAGPCAPVSHGRGPIRQDDVFTVIPSTLTLKTGSAYTFTTSDGTPPVTWALTQNNSIGNIAADSGAYVAGAVPGTQDIVTATDSTGATATSTVTVVEVDNPNITIQPANPSIGAGSTIPFSATGGYAAGGYTWSILTNESGGTISSGTGLYTAGSTPGGADEVQVTDAVGDWTTTEVSVVNPLVLLPAAVTIATGGTQAFVAVGGILGFDPNLAWTMESNPSGGTITQAGLYTAGTTAGVIDVVKVQDDSGDIATTPVTVVASGPYTTIPLTGCAIAGYTTPTTIGSQTFQLTLDTGSTALAVAGDTCTEDCSYIDPLYAPGDTATDLMQTVGDSYDSGTVGWTGELMSDQITIGGVPAVNINFGMITNQNDLFLGTGCYGYQDLDQTQGILGMAPGPATQEGSSAPILQEYFNQLVSMDQDVGNVFAFQLCGLAGNLWLGGYDSAFASGAPQYTPLVSSSDDLLGSSYYAINIADVTLDGISLGYTDSVAGPTVIDTGSAGLVLPASVVQALATALAVDPNMIAAFPSLDDGDPAYGQGAFFGSTTGLDSCLTPAGTLTRAELDGMLPPLVITFPNASGVEPFSLVLPATHSYLIPSVDTIGNVVNYCAGVQAQPSLSENGTPLDPTPILGANVLSSNLTIVDVGNQRVGFAPQSGCQ